MSNSPSDSITSVVQNKIIEACQTAIKSSTNTQMLDMVADVGELDQQVERMGKRVGLEGMVSILSAGTHLINDRKL